MRITFAALLLLGAAPQGDPRAAFEAARAADPVSAFRRLADNPGVPAPFARAALSRQIGEDLAAGFQAFEAGKLDELDRRFTRAALLADPYAREFSAELFRWILLAKAPHRTLTDCPTCRNLGSAPCTDCQAGRSPQPCPPCGAKGAVPCFLCDGSGTLDHHGYQGTLVLSVTSDTRVSFKNDQGKILRGTLDAQTLTYRMRPCASGSFALDTESVVRKTGVKKSGSTSQPCEKFWKEMKMFVFNGKAKIQVSTPGGKLAPLPPAGARRFFGEYETCEGGRVPCDRCAGRKTDPCSLCAGKGQASLPCASCEGSALRACGNCRGAGDASWLVRVIPQAPALGEALRRHAALLRDWRAARSIRETRAADLARRLEDARKDADPAAKFNAERGVVDVKCPRCKGAGGDCEECWASGRREHPEGSATYERYALIDRLARQKDAVAKAVPAPLPLLPPLPDADAPVGATPPPPPVVALPAGAPVAIPKTVEEMIAKADALYQAGRGHLEKSKAAGSDAGWIEEGLQAVKTLRDAQTLYASAQERLDELGRPVPMELQQKIRTALQALVMARKQIP
jgi:hypothetical protein